LTPSAAPAPLRAVLFDLDGTLIDSEPVWAAAMRALAATRGERVPDDLLLRISGLDARQAMLLVHEELGWPAGAVEEDLAFVQGRVGAALRRGPRWLPGARDLVAAARRVPGLATGLVTATYRPLVDLVLADLGTAAFDVVVCGNEGDRPKPDPMPYLSAVRRLGVPAGGCVAIEDSVRGVASARAAGCAVLQVSPHAAAPGAHAYAPTLHGIDVATLAGLLELATAASPGSVTAGRSAGVATLAAAAGLGRRRAAARSGRALLDPAVLAHPVEAEPSR
jgi:HAD superfamily hydrolase (TIGR01509 family)